jgi:hypothetical protein
MMVYNYEMDRTVTGTVLSCPAVLILYLVVASFRS